MFLNITSTPQQHCRHTFPTSIPLCSHAVPHSPWATAMQQRLPHAAACATPSPYHLYAAEMQPQRQLWLATPGWTQPAPSPRHLKEASLDQRCSNPPHGRPTLPPRHPRLPSGDNDIYCCCGSVLRYRGSGWFYWFYLEINMHSFMQEFSSCNLKYLLCLAAGFLWTYTWLFRIGT